MINYLQRERAAAQGVVPDDLAAVDRLWPEVGVQRRDIRCVLRSHADILPRRPRVFKPVGRGGGRGVAGAEGAW